MPNFSDLFHQESFFFLPQEERDTFALMFCGTYLALLVYFRITFFLDTPVIKRKENQNVLFGLFL